MQRIGSSGIGFNQDDKGRTLLVALKINFLDVLTYLEEIPPSKYECIHLAINTVVEGAKTSL